MKNKFNVIFLMTLIFSSSAFSASEIKAEDDYSWIEKLNFDKKSEIKYKAENDEYDISGEQKTHALIKETLSSLSSARLEEEINKADEELVKMTIKCYQGKFDDALKIADTIYSSYKNNPSYWNQLGSCFYLQDDLAKAILFYNKARDLDLKYAPPVNNLGVVYVKQGKFQKAHSAFKKAADLGPFSATPNFNLASLYVRFGSIKKAISILQGLLKKSPADEEVNSLLASAYLLQGDTSLALATFATLNQSTLKKPSVGLNYAVALKDAKRVDDAKSALNNVTASTNLAQKEYAQKVENYIRN